MPDFDVIRHALDLPVPIDGGSIDMRAATWIGRVDCQSCMWWSELNGTRSGVFTMLSERLARHRTSAHIDGSSDAG